MKNPVATSAAYDRMCTSIDEMHAFMTDGRLDALAPTEQLALCARIAASGHELEGAVAAVRIRAERPLQVLLRDAAGMRPKNKADAQWLSQME